GSTRDIQCSECARVLSHVYQHHVFDVEFRFMAVNEIPGANATTGTWHRLDTDLSRLRKRRILDRHKRAENGRHGFPGHRADTLHLWNNHRPEYVSELSGFKTHPTSERNCERHTGGDYRNASGTTLSRPCANRNWSAELW